MNKSLYIAVIGCGRLGSILASDLSKQGHQVVVIDRHKSAFNNLSAEFSGFSVDGDAAESKVLRAANSNKAQVTMAAVIV